MGPRQSGKTTLIRTLIDETWEYVTLDDQAQLEIARADPAGFVRSLPPRRVALDEVQRVPDLFVSIKQAVDEHRTPGRFLLTGSANALLLPRLSDSLAGRMESVQLKPLSECEIRDHEPAFLRDLLQGRAPSACHVRVRDHLLERLVKGCFRRAAAARERTAQHGVVSAIRRYADPARHPGFGAHRSLRPDDQVVEADGVPYREARQRGGAGKQAGDGSGDRQEIHGPAGSSVPRRAAAGMAHQITTE